MSTAAKCPVSHAHGGGAPQANQGAAQAASAGEKSDLSLNRGGEGSKCDFHSTGRQGARRPGRGGFPVLYHSYLQLDKILGAQELMSARRPGSEGFGPEGRGAHDEHLFIVIHQTYELWFKQILHELEDVLRIFGQESIPEKQMGTVVRRLKRITEIQRVLLDQLTVLETMTPLGFLEFRDYLFPASGFQSLQFRLIENRLGLLESRRLKYSGRHYCSYLPPDHATAISKAGADPSLFELVEKWLERTPFLQLGDYSFWQSYRTAVDSMVQRDLDEISGSANWEDVSEEEKAQQIKDVEKSREHYLELLNENKHKQAVARGDRRLSYKALQAALLITLYQDEPILQLPAEMLRLLVDVDEMLTLWRHRHALMVHRMIGRKLGTGGSSGFQYLRATAERHKIFNDLFNLSTYMIPAEQLPPLPRTMRQALDFRSSEVEAPSPKKRQRTE